MYKKISLNITSGLLVINMILFIISFSITFVILFRPFYYYQIKSLNIDKSTKYTYMEIKEAYDDIIDYCTIKNNFKTGIIKHSNVGYDHFRDCKKLFMINFIILGISSIIIILKHIFLKQLKIKNYNIEFFSACLIVIISIVLFLTSIIIGFEKFFEIFHKLFFFGKDNWILDSDIDEIVDIFPQQYFMNCAILILVIILSFSVFLILKEFIKRNHSNIE